MQLLAFASVYLLAGAGCTAFALLRCGRRHPLDLLSMITLWPLCAPFLFAEMVRPWPAISRSPEEEREVLAAHGRRLQLRLVEIDSLLGQEDWNPESLTRQRKALDPQHPSTKSAVDSLSLRLDYIERLTFLRKIHADELEEANALLEQLKSQEQLSRFLGASDGEVLPPLDAIRSRIADSECVLASEAELMALCHQSLCHEYL